MSVLGEPEIICTKCREPWPFGKEHVCVCAHAWTERGTDPRGLAYGFVVECTRCGEPYPKYVAPKEKA